MRKLIVLIIAALAARVAVAQPQTGTDSITVSVEDSLPQLARAEAYDEHGRILASQGRYKLAIWCYDKAITLDSGNGNYYSDRGYALLRCGNYDQAIADGNKAIILKPDLFRAYRLLGRAYNKKGDKVSSKKNFEAALKSVSENAYPKRGQIYTDLEEYDKAISIFDLAISEQAWNPYLFLDRGLAYYYSKEYDKAIIDFSTAIYLKPAHTEAYVWRGLAYKQLKDLVPARNDFDKAIELQPEYANAYGNRGQLSRYQKLYDQGIADLTKAIRLDPENPRHYLERAGIYHDMVDYRLALEDYNRAVEIRPEDAGNYAWRGAFFLFWGEYDQAIKDNNRALELDSKSITALLNRSVTFYCMGEYENAIEDCDRIIELTKDKKTFHYYGSMGLKYFCQGKFGQAVGEYSQALKKRPDWAGVYCRRGDAYDKLGKRNKAMTDWTKANQLDHFYPFAADARAAIGAVDLKKQ